MSFWTPVGMPGKRATVTIAWPVGGPAERTAPVHPMDHSGFGIASGACVATARGLLPASALVSGDVLPDGRGGTARLAATIRLTTDLGTERVTIRAGALGGGLPRADLVVGRYTRLRLRSGLAERLVGEAEVLVAAECLVGREGVSLTPVNLADVVHLVFEEHATFVAEDLVVEAMVPTAAFLESLPHRNAQPAFQALPKLRYAGSFAVYATDMPELDARETRQILAADASFGTDTAALGAGTPDLAPRVPRLVSASPVPSRRSQPPATCSAS